ncbi:type II toxin-antitoxin system mRNA interferase toxin, RelE/StbE family [Enterobacter sp.]|uniref:type II toxin-antitoxin system YafQ family toxin n=1 Tax=Enterobacter sp. TaxID=42895 RepID=UPI00296F7155|nr:type II toxin-antitoxin system mRNA interferase toxin, RelE/StbE family [Enterobacter sp.]
MGNKRVPLPYQTTYTRTFRKAWTRYYKTGRYDLSEAVSAMNLVASRLPLPAFYRDHELTGDYEGFRKLHIGGDFLLVYLVDDDKEVITYTHLGTHAELFKNG